MITGAQLIAARKLLDWEQDRLAKRAKLPVTVIKRAELSPGEPVITITQLDARRSNVCRSAVVVAVHGVPAILPDLPLFRS